MCSTCSHSNWNMRDSCGRKGIGETVVRSTERLTSRPRKASIFQLRRICRMYEFHTIFRIPVITNRALKKLNELLRRTNGPIQGRPRKSKQLFFMTKHSNIFFLTFIFLCFEVHVHIAESYAKI